MPRYGDIPWLLTTILKNKFPVSKTPPPPPPDSSPEPVAPSPAPSPAPSAASPGNSNKKLFLYGGIGAAILAVVAIIAVGAFVFLSDSGPPSAGSVLGLAPEDSRTLIFWNVREAVDGSVADAFVDHDYMAYHVFPDFDNAYDVDPLDVEHYALLVLDEGGQVEIAKGEFFFDDFRDDLEGRDYDENSYRGYEIWNGLSDSVAFLEEDGFVIFGSEDDVESILNNLYRDAGSLESSSESELKIVIERLGNPVAYVASTNDELCHISRCRGFGIGISSFGLDDPDLAEANYVVLFSSDRSAESAADDYDEVSDFFENMVDLEIDDAESDKEFVFGTGSGDVFFVEDLTP